MPAGLTFTNAVFSANQTKEGVPKLRIFRFIGKGHPLSDGQIMYEIDKHRKYTGYGRIAYVHNDDHFKTILFKANGGQSIKWLNPFTLQIPKFGKIHLLAALNKNELHPDFTEIKLKQLKNNRYQLQITTPKKFKKEFTS